MLESKLQEKVVSKVHWRWWVLLVALAPFLAGANSAVAALYKWVDDKGNVHYSDKMPPEAVDRPSVELNPQGIPIKKNDAAPTVEQRRAKAADEERARQVAKQQEEVNRRDRALLSSYTNEAEIDLARNRSLQTINDVVESSKAYTEQLTKRKTEAEAKMAGAKNKTMIPLIERELESIDAELARQADLVEQKKREATAISARYDADKQRWRELVAMKQASDARNGDSQKMESVPAPKAAAKK